MADSNDLSSTIATGANGPQSVTSDGLTVSSQRIPDLISADQYLAKRAARGRAARGLRFTKLIGPLQCPVIPGSVLDQGGAAFGAT